MTNSNDLELVELFQKGDETSYNELVGRYQEKVYWIARRFVNDHDQADDVVQEVFVKVYGALKQFRGDSSVYTWLYRITVNVALNTIRKQRIRDFVRIDEHFEAKVDAVLEKVTRHGKQSLTDAENDILMRASELYKKRRS